MSPHVVPTESPPFVTRLTRSAEDGSIQMGLAAVLLIVGTNIAEAFVATYRMERACAMQLAFQQSGAAFNPIGDAVVSASYSAGRNNPASSTAPTRPTGNDVGETSHRPLHSARTRSPDEPGVYPHRSWTAR